MLWRVWRNEHSAEVDASSEAVWGVWTDVPGWPRFLGMRWARLDGEFAVGGRGRIKPTHGPPSSFRIAAVEPGRYYATEASMPGASLRFEHLVAPIAAGGTRVVERQTIEGPLSRLYGWLLGRQMVSELPGSLEKLGNLAREREGQSS
jgi:hypothetical protein